MPDELKPEPRADFAADFRDGEGMAREWIAGRGDLPDLLHIVRDMPRGGELGGLEAGFLSTIDAAVRGDPLGLADAPDATKARLLLKAPPSAGASPLPPLHVDKFRRRQRERERAASARGIRPPKPGGLYGAATCVHARQPDAGMMRIGAGGEGGRFSARPPMTALDPGCVKTWVELES